MKQTIVCSECGEEFEGEIDGDTECPDCGTIHWGDVIPVQGEVSPAECVDYPAHPATVAEDEATSAVVCGCGHLMSDHLQEGCVVWEGARFCQCTRAGDAPTSGRASSVWLSVAARQDAARARRTAAETFEADNGRAEWQPSAEAKKLIKELNG